MNPTVRKLLWTACGYTVALLLAHSVLRREWLLWAVGAAAVLALASGFLKVRLRPVFLLVSCSAAVGFLWMWGYTALFVQPAETYVGEQDTVTVRVVAYADKYNDYARVEVRSVDETIPHVRMYVYDYDHHGIERLRPGDLAEMPLKLLSARTQYGQESGYYLGEGIHLRGYLTGGYNIIGQWKFRWLFFPQTLAKVIKEQALSCFPDDVAPLMKALLTGDRTEYYLDDELYSAMRVAGFVHIIAVSGMHVGFLVGILRLFTGRRRISAFLGIPMIVVFMAMVGFTPSVVRAGVMQILLLIAPILRREPDPLTSLAAALLLLLLANPYAVGSLSLQLSFAAMAGIILISPRIFDWAVYDHQEKSRLPKGRIGGFWRWVCSTVSSSIGALVFTTPIVAIQFGFVPLYSILTNLLCLWAMSTAFMWGYAVCLLGLLWHPLGVAAGWLVGWLPRYAIFVVKRIARFPFAAVYTQNNLGGWWLGFVYALFLSAYVMKGAERYRPVFPLCGAVLTLCVMTLFLRQNLGDNQLAFTAVDVGQGQSLVVMTDSVTVVIDCGSSDNVTNAGDTTTAYLLKNGRSRVDLMVLTHFDSDHVNGVKRLMSQVDVERLAIAAEYAENDYSENILTICAKYGTQIYRVAENTSFWLDKLELKVFAPMVSGEENDEGLFIYGDWGDCEFLVTGDASSKVERLFLKSFDPGDMELLVAGHHGSKTSTCAELLDSITPEVALISVGEGNRYGHPAPEVLERLELRRIPVYRTDQQGTVTVTMGRNNGKSG